MAKFNKDRFINDITGKVQSAIDRHLLTDEDIEGNDLDRLHGFIQYELTELIDDRKFGLDVLMDFNYDEKESWDSLQEKFGKFKNIMDIALVNLWRFLENEGATDYSYYHKADTSADAALLDMARDEEEPDEDSEENEDADTINADVRNSERNRENDDFEEQEEQPAFRRRRF